MKVYCVGIGGAGVSGMARVGSGFGHEVRGSDMRATELTRSLDNQGIAISYHQDGSAVAEDTDLIICSAAVPKDHPELRRGGELGIPVAKYSEMLGALLRERQGFALAGTHGKTTSCSLTAFAFRECGADPTFVIGGEIPQLGGSASCGHGPHAIVEACEYDRSFLRYEPAVGVILNIEEDHFDCFDGGLDELIGTFTDFGRRIAEGGTLLSFADCPSTARAVAEIHAHRPDIKLRRFGLGPGADVRAEEIRLEPRGARFSLVIDGRVRCEVALSIPGEHNVINALAALACAEIAGLDVEAAAEAVGRFEGVERRFSVLRSGVDRVVVDDYAHHPTAIEAVIGAARQRFPGRRVVTVFEPHQHNRTRHLFDDFTRALAAADSVVVTDIYRCRDSDEDVQAVSGTLLAEAVRRRHAGTRARYLPRDERFGDALEAIARDGDVLLFMGAGHISELAHSFAERIPEPSIADARTSTAVRCRPIMPSDPGLASFDRAPVAPPQSQPMPRLAVSVRSCLARELGLAIRFDEELGRHHTLRTKSTARLFVEPRSQDELVFASSRLRARGVPQIMLGGGSNILFAEEAVEGAVVSTRRLDGIRSLDRGFSVEAGLLLQKLLHALEGRGMAGLEGLAGIPARMGGAIAMNCGGPPNRPAVGDYIERVLVLEVDGRRRWLGRRSAGFRYRGSELDGRVIIAAELGGFASLDIEALRARRFEIARRKARLQPLASANAGCVFKNPKGDSAGRLIDAAGCKGLRIGDAAVSERHANFIINRGQAAPGDILGLAELVRERVAARFGIRLELELRVVSFAQVIGG